MVEQGATSKPDPFRFPIPHSLPDLLTRPLLWVGEYRDGQEKDKCYVSPTAKFYAGH